MIGIDRDQSAVALGTDLVEQAGGRLTLIEDRFSNLDAIARDTGYDAVDGVVLDLGVSSMQLDSGERGFSFRHDGPLDMRMSREGATAADVVNSATERDLAGIIFTLGEERQRLRLTHRGQPGGVDRQRHHEAHTTISWELGLNLPVVQLNDLPTDEESQP